MKEKKKYIVGALIAIGIGLFLFAAIIQPNDPVDGKPFDLVLCLDDSELFYDWQESRNKSAATLTKKLGDNINMGALYYQNNVTSEADIRALNSQEARKNLCQFFETAVHEDKNPNTNMASGIKEATKMLISYKEENPSENEKIILLLTDGTNRYYDEDGTCLVDMQEEAYVDTKKAVKEAWEAGISVRFICYYDEIPTFLSDLSKEYAADVIQIDHSGNLDQAFSEALHTHIKQNIQGGKTGMELLILLLIIGIGCVAGYYYHNYKKKEYILDYEVNMMEDEKLQKEKKAELDAHIRKEQQNKKFYLDIILTHGNAIGAKACLDNEGRRRTGIISFGDITMIGKNNRGEDYFYRIDEAGMEIWATFEENELLLKSKQTPFEIRTEGTPRDQGTRTQKAVLKANQQYYIILDSKYEIGLLAQKN